MKIDLTKKQIELTREQIENIRCALETICDIQNYTYVFEDEEHRDHCAALDDFNNAVEEAVKEQK